MTSVLKMIQVSVIISLFVKMLQTKNFICYCNCIVIFENMVEGLIEIFMK